MNNNEKTERFSKETMSLGRKGTREVDNLWKKVTFGTATGILLGAGATQAYNHFKTDHNEDNVESTENSPIDTEVEVPVYGEAPVAHVSNSMSFNQAFAAARAEVGPGGVFAWHGGIYGTYYETEWDAMSDAERAAYAKSVHPEVSPQHVHTDLLDEAHPDIVVSAQENHEQTDVQIDGVTSDDDVRILGYSQVQGHNAVALDFTGNNETDAVIIDLDDTGTLTEPDVVVYRDGMATTVGDIVEGNPPVSIIGDEQQVNLVNPDVAPDMPDYMDDVLLV